MGGDLIRENCTWREIKTSASNEKLVLLVRFIFIG